NGKYKWPRDSKEAKQITQQEFRWLMEGLSIEQKTAIRPAKTGLTLTVNLNNKSDQDCP
uniref:IS66 family insertion sequence element accessory protein TnpB n=1 Tax=uncultured Ruminococcus sp. TaxID=165186 RepID=UPI003431A0FD